MKQRLITSIFLLLAVIPTSAESTLEIQCSGLRKGDNAVFGVYDMSNRLLYTISLHGEGVSVLVSRRIRGLSAGQYRVSDMGWNWSYTLATPSVTMSVADDATATFQFQATKRSGTVTNFEDSEINRFNEVH